MSDFPLFIVKELGGEGLAVSRNIELYSYAFGLTFASLDCTFQRCVNLNIEPSSYFGFCKGLPMEIHEGLAEISIYPESIEFRSSLQREFSQSFSLSSGGINLQKNSSFRFPNRYYLKENVYNTYARQFIPPINDVGFLVEFR